MQPRRAKRQQQAYAFIRQFCVEHGYSPSVREIAEGLGCPNSTASIVVYLVEMRQRGMVTFADGQPRTVRVVE